MRAGIVGAGNIGSVLAIQFKELGFEEVLLANSRGPHTLEAEAVRTKATPVEISKVAEGVDILVITIPMKAIPLLSQGLLSSIPANAIVIDTCNYYPLRDGKVEELEGSQTTEAAWVSKALNRPTVKVFNNIIRDSLLYGGKPAGTKERIALPVSSDDEQKKAAVIALLDRMGFDGYDAGPLAESWRFQPGTPVYCVDPTREQIGRLLDKADREASPAHRDQGYRLVSKLAADFPQQHLVAVSRLMSGLDIWSPKTYYSLARVAIAMLWR
jgi:predicted dinucleotide-binding enzyme